MSTVHRPPSTDLHRSSIQFHVPSSVHGKRSTNTHVRSFYASWRSITSWAQVQCIATTCILYKYTSSIIKCAHAHKCERWLWLVTALVCAYLESATARRFSCLHWRTTRRWLSRTYFCNDAMYDVWRYQTNTMCRAK